MKRAFTEFLKRLSGLNTPFGGISWSPPKDEKQIVYGFIQQLVDHRLVTGIGHCGFSYEKVVSSLERARAEATATLSLLCAESPARPNVEGIRSALQLFQGLVEAEFPKGEVAPYVEGYDGDMRSLFVDACMRMQSVVGTYVRSLGTIYHLSLSADIIREFRGVDRPPVVENCTYNESFASHIESETLSPYTLKAKESSRLRQLGMYSLYRNCLPAVVVVRYYSHGCLSDIGGFVISATGHIVTADVAAIEADRLRIVFRDGMVHPAVVEWTTHALGVALLRVHRRTEDTLSLAVEPPCVGTRILAIRSTFNQHGIPHVGEVARVTERDVEYAREEQRICGLAGSPMLDRAGRVVGIHRKGWADASRFGGVGQGLRGDTARKHLEDLGLRLP